MLKTRLRWILPWVWFFGCIAALFVFMQLRMDYVLDSDMASELVLSKLLASENAILSANWYYATELHVFFSQVIFAPLFKLFTDWHTVRMVGSFILYALLLGSYYYLCVPLHLTKWFPITASVLILPVSTLYFQFAIYATPYTFYMTAAFFLLGLMLRFPHAKAGRTRTTLGCGVGAVSLLTGLNGPRYLMVFFVPMAAAALVLAFVERQTLFANGRLNEKGRVRALFLLIVAVAGVCAAIGYLLNVTVLARVYTFAHYEGISNDAFSLVRLQELINGWLATLGYTVTGRFLSVHGVRNAISLGLTVLIILAVRQTLKNPQRYTQAERSLAGFFLASLLLFFAMYLLTDAAYNDRYLLPVMVFALPVTVVFLRAVAVAARRKGGCLYAAGAGVGL